MPRRKFDDSTESKPRAFDPLPFQKNVFGAVSRQPKVAAAAADASLTTAEKSSLNRFINSGKTPIKMLAVASFLAGCLALLFFLPKTKPVSKTAGETEECRCETADLETVNFGFPDLADEFQPPSWWKKLYETDARKFSIFRLSQDYPVRLADSNSCAEGVGVIRRWENFDFRTESKEYMNEILRYAFEGNLEIDWRVRENAARKWLHAPWMHAGRYGREFVRGLTKERKTCRSELLGSREKCAPEAEKYQSWAIAFYNSHGAFYLGKVWQEMTGSEKPSAKNFPAEGFPAGTVSLKLIFTEADAAAAPYLENSVEWLADTKRARASGFAAADCLDDNGAGEVNLNCFARLRLLQVDVAARDDRSPTGWVFGTFTYNKDAEPIFDYPFAANMSAAERDYLQKWLRLEFVGLMFGNDEGVTISGGNLSESVINRQNPIKSHLGCGGRLNGMIDAPVSSCFSCHSMAETPKNLAVKPMPYEDMKCREDQLERWFRTINPRGADLARRTFTAPEEARAAGEEFFPLDYSLQLREGIMRYCEENKQKCGLPD